MKQNRPSHIEVTDGRSKVTVALSFVTKKRLILSVYPDKRVVAKAPKRASTKELVAFVEKRIPWIFKQLEYLDQLPPPPPRKQFVDGELHPFMGRQIRLKVEKGDGNTLRLLHGVFVMTLESNADGMAEVLMKKWYSRVARAILADRFRRIFPRFGRMGVKRPEVRFRRMKSRWGSCNKSKGVILLNTELVKASPLCIDYVLIHELCHMIHPSHGKDFYKLLDKIVPDWRVIKDKLEGTRI